VDKRTFLKAIMLGTAGIFATGFGSLLKAAKNRKSWDGVFKLPELPYAYNALEPFIDAATMEIHHTRHHAAYTDKFNAAVAEAGLTGKTAHDILKEVSLYSAAIRNNGGGYLNHKLFWMVLAPPAGMKPSASLSAAIEKDFGSFTAFRDAFNAAAKSLFGSGWVWLIIGAGGKLQITATPNQDSPIMDIASDKGMPLLCLDVWEHAYYLKYQNRRVEYIDAFWNVVNWDFVSQRFDTQIKQQQS